MCLILRYYEEFCWLLSTNSSTSGRSIRHLTETRACYVGLSQVTQRLRRENAVYVFQTKEEYNGYRLQPSLCRWRKTISWHCLWKWQCCLVPYVCVSNWCGTWERESDWLGSNFFQTGTGVMEGGLATFQVSSPKSCTDFGVSRSREGKRKLRKRHDCFFWVTGIASNRIKWKLLIFKKLWNIIPHLLQDAIGA